MDEFDPAPTTDDQAEIRWSDGADTFTRVYDVLLGTGTLTAYTDIADLADCSPNAAKKHLDRLDDMGIARAETESRPARYARNDAYLEWQEASRIARELSSEEITARVRKLEAKREAYAERFETTDPTTVAALADDHDTVHERLEAISEWRGLTRDIRLYELAYRLDRNDGHFVRA